MDLRPTSNFHWRTDPYIPNGTSSDASLFGGADFRIAYWMGRYLTVR